MMVVAALAGVAHADDQATSQALFDKARELTKKEKWDEACPLFEESQKLAPTNNTLFYLADCEQHVGRTASAWANFVVVADRAKAAGETAKEAFARKRADALAPILCKVQVNVAAPSPGLVVKRGGNEVVKAEWGLALPSDPGVVIVEASAPSMTTWSKPVKLEAGTCNGKTEIVDVPALEKASSTAATPISVPPPASETPTDASASPIVGANDQPVDTGAPSTKSSGGLGFQRTLAIVAGGVGVVTAGVGFLVRTSGKNQYDDAVARCTLPGPNPCSAADADDATSGRNKKTLGWIVVGMGGALVAGGIVLWLTAPSEKKSEQAFVAPWVGASVSGIQVQGRF
jgi:serine/threonine-protein kinase